MEIPVKTNILDKNAKIANRVNQRLRESGIITINLMGSPGSGKTSLLEQTIVGLKGKLKLAVIEGDLFTSKDADRINAYGVPVIQINTSGGCHLDASMIELALTDLELKGVDLLIIENVGNLVCPAEFELGEDSRALVFSITEGEDKPLKYPLIFKRSAAVIINKIDLLPHTAFDMTTLIDDIKAINPSVQIIAVSCHNGEGFGDWLNWLCEQVQRKKK
ncbi:hydantoin utilization protein A [Anaerosporomusa subterranea]|uniref:Hydantoin utilization protein A n=1 Tax=Anaerosporomusa subterranea TaxID=1794912 RepID=A0A154BSD3_ANASB|nr:hydrogenase nickel incorporation protein HypB [Anaerosporomusa subterranea]KYZ76882.1 hydantoin utilization protein A [Anaerosporomusa subterranea]